jgi:hypothetical protein
MDRPRWSDDKNVVSVRRRLKERARKGVRKYGTTTMREDVDLAGWLRHLQEELMDAAIYIEAAIRKVEGEK